MMVHWVFRLDVSVSRERSTSRNRWLNRDLPQRYTQRQVCNYAKNDVTLPGRLGLLMLDLLCSVADSAKGEKSSLPARPDVRVTVAGSPPFVIDA